MMRGGVGGGRGVPSTRDPPLIGLVEKVKYFCVIL